jgi:monoamine oxidase
MSANLNDLSSESAASLPKPMDVYLGGFTHQWTPEATPYIGGGFHSPLAGGRSDYASVIARPVGNIFFCGEVTSLKAGGTAHAALETGLRAAREVASYLKHQDGSYGAPEQAQEQEKRFAALVQED